MDDAADLVSLASSIMSEETPNSLSPKVEKIKRDLEAWLSAKNWSFDELIAWLKGYALPGVGYDREPYFWITISLANSEDARREMAHRIAQFLTSETYKNSNLDDGLFYNLFQLAASLGSRNVLAAPLARVFDHFNNDELQRAEFFGKSQRYNLNNAFREALIVNQVDATYKDLWFAGLNGKQEEVFPAGDVYSDFRGIVSLTHDGGPMVDEIGVALTALTRYLDPENRRDRKFRLLIARVKEVWESRGVTKDWDEIFFRQAMRHDWPKWAIVELNSLNIAAGSISDTMTRYLIWEIYLPFLEELGVVFDVVEQKGILLEINASAEAALFLEKTRFTIEEIRNRSPFRRYRSLLGVANQGFMDLELYFGAAGETRLAAAIDEGRRTILKTLGLDFPAQIEIEGEVPQAHLVALLQAFTPQPAIFVGFSG